MEDPRQAGEGSRTCHVHAVTHVQLQGPGTVTFRLCSCRETGRVKRDTFDREQRPRGFLFREQEGERDRVWQNMSHPEACRDTVTPPAPTPRLPGTGNESHHPSQHLYG